MRYLLCCLLTLQFVPPAQLYAATPPPAQGRNGMVASAHPLATEAGLSVLRSGGNAVDAAAAVAFAISVVEPFSASIGGGGFALYYDKKSRQTRALDFRERAPLAAHRDLYLDGSGNVIPEASTRGHRAVAVPGTVAGLHQLVKSHGALKWSQVLAPAIDLAQRGFVVTPRFQMATESQLEALAADPGARDVFLKDGKPYVTGDLLLQRDLAETLQQIASQGPQAFYSGDIAQALVGDMAESGGLITRRDLKSYRPKWRQPVVGSYRGHSIVSMPLPSSGGVLLLQILGLLERDQTSTREYNDVRTLHTLIEAERRAYADRAELLGDPAFIRTKPKQLYAAARLDKLYRSIQSTTKTPSSDLAKGFASPREGTNTSHICVVDAAGNAVALTFTVNTVFGSKVVVPGTGILLNNEMDDFSVKPGAPNAYGLVGNEANAIAPAKIPLSSMTPTLVFKDDVLLMVVGSPGGSTIITTVLQVVLNVVDYNMDIATAVAAPRVHHQWLPDEVYYEPYGLDPVTRDHLQKMGHVLVQRHPWGNATAIQVLPGPILLGTTDPRGEGSAKGW